MKHKDMIAESGRRRQNGKRRRAFPLMDKKGKVERSSLIKLC